MAFAGLNDKLNSIRSNTLSSDIKMILIEDLIDSSDNFFEMSCVEELAEAILLQDGVKENLIVQELPNGKYEIISGHRRKAAVQYLIDKGENVSHKLPCLITGYKSDDEKQLELIMMNVSQRVLTDKEIYEAYFKLKKIFENQKYEIRAKGEKAGKTREKIKEVLNISAGQQQKLSAIEKNAIPEVKEAILDNELSINMAEKISKLDEEQQREYANNNFENITTKEVESKKTNTDNKKGVINDTFEKNKDTSAGGTVNVSSENGNHESILKFISENKAKLSDTINELIDCLDEGSSEQNVIKQLAAEIAKF